MKLEEELDTVTQELADLGHEDIDSTATESDECSLRVMTRTYRKDGQRTMAKFVAGVLVEYTISPE